MRRANRIRRFLALALTVLLTVSAVPMSAASERRTEILTSYNPDNYLAMRIDGETLTVTGKIRQEGLHVAAICCSNEAWSDDGVYVECADGALFSASVPLSSVTGKTAVKVYVNTDATGGMLMGYQFDGVYVDRDQAGCYFPESPVSENNAPMWDRGDPAAYRAPDYDADELIDRLIRSVEAGDWDKSVLNVLHDQLGLMNFAFETLDGKLTPKYRDMVENWRSQLKAALADDTIRQLSNRIVGGETDEYKKLVLLYRWVAENVYYDFDAFTGRASVNTVSRDVAGTGRAICEGYANLFRDLIQAQGIPAVCVCSYSLGIGTDGTFDDAANYAETEPNHKHVEAWVNDRWVIMDVTWDSHNTYENGQYRYSPSTLAFFDMTKDVFSFTHKLLPDPDNPEPPAKPAESAESADAPSSWAEAEVGLAVSCGLVPASLQSRYQTGITRAEFCTLVVRMLCARFGKTDARDLLGLGTDESLPAAFDDTADADVTAAYRLGVVSGVGNGKFEPTHTLTREQAATMLKRAADVLGISASGEGNVFSDDDAISPWAKAGVAFVSALVSEDGAAVMGGVGDNRFNPAGFYTIEQSILTLYRLYRCR